MKLFHPGTQPASEPLNLAGSATLKVVADIREARNANASQGEFAPGSRTPWHAHTGMALLYIIQGTCRAQQWGDSLLEAKTGDLLFIQPQAKHWYGAGPDAGMRCLSILIDAQTSWMEAVTEEQYAGTQVKPAPDYLPRRAPRRQPRVPLAAHAENVSSGLKASGSVGNISEGGMLMLTRHPFEVGDRLKISFHLPAGQPLAITGIVRHHQPGIQMGIQFVDLNDAHRKAIAEYVKEIKPYARRSARVERRLKVILRWRDLQGNAFEEEAETLVLSKHGGLLVCPARFKAGQDADLWWPEHKKGARIRIVFRRLGRFGNLTEVAFEFVEADDFWDIAFPSDPQLWKPPIL